VIDLSAQTGRLPIRVRVAEEGRATPGKDDGRDQPSPKPRPDR
jgi:hypothetical protein